MKDKVLGLFLHTTLVLTKLEDHRSDLCSRGDQRNKLVYFQQRTNLHTAIEKLAVLHIKAGGYGCNKSVRFIVNNNEAVYKYLTGVAQRAWYILRCDYSVLSARDPLSKQLATLRASKRLLVALFYDCINDQEDRHLPMLQYFARTGDVEKLSWFRVSLFCYPTKNEVLNLQSMHEIVKDGESRRRRCFINDTAFNQALKSPAGKYVPTTPTISEILFGDTIESIFYDIDKLKKRIY